MKNINHITGDNFGGLQHIYYTDQENVDFSQFPRANGLALVDDIILKPGKTWGLICFSRRTPGFNQPSKSDRRGTLYTHEIKGFLPKETLELATINYEMNSERRYLVLHQDWNGNLKLSGSPDYGLKFESRLQIREGLESLAGYDAGFKAEATMPALFYTGRYQVTDLGWLGESPELEPVTLEFAEQEFNNLEFN